MNEHVGDTNHLNDLDARINIKGYFERILGERDRVDGEREKRLDERFNSQEKRLNERAESQQKAIDAALLAAKEAVNAAFISAKEAVNKAEEAQLRVNVTQNEFRGQLKDQNAATERIMMPRAETESLMREQREKMAALDEKISEVRSLVLIGPPSLPQLQSQADQTQGQRAGKDAIIAWVIAAAAVLIAMGSLLAKAL